MKNLDLRAGIRSFESLPLAKTQVFAFVFSGALSLKLYRFPLNSAKMPDLYFASYQFRLSGCISEYSQIYNQSYPTFVVLVSSVKYEDDNFSKLRIKTFLAEAGGPTMSICTGSSAAIAISKSLLIS
jgi:hypothetical protein